MQVHTATHLALVGQQHGSCTTAEEAVAEQHRLFVASVPVLGNVLRAHNQGQRVGPRPAQAASETLAVATHAQAALPYLRARLAKSTATTEALQPMPPRLKCRTSLRILKRLTSWCSACRWRQARLVQKRQSEKPAAAYNGGKRGCRAEERAVDDHNVDGARVGASAFQEVGDGTTHDHVGLTPCASDTQVNLVLHDA